MCLMRKVLRVRNTYNLKIGGSHTLFASHQNLRKITGKPTQQTGLNWMFFELKDSTDLELAADRLYVKQTLSHDLSEKCLLVE